MKVIKNHASVSLTIALTSEQPTGSLPWLVLPGPLSVCYAVTEQCDYHCPHCMSASTLHSRPGLPAVRVKQLFQILKDAGVLRVDVVGGEPFLRTDLLELLAHARGLGLEVVVTTHGGLLTEAHAHILAGLGIFVQVSLDGPRDINDRLRGHGSYDAAVRAIRVLVSTSVPVRITCTIQHANLGVLDDVLAIARETGARSVYLNLVCAQGRADRLRDRICLTPDDEEAIRRQVAEIRRRSEADSQLLDFKQSGRAGVFIESNGDFVSQGWAEEDCVPLGNVFTNDLHAMWQKTRIDHAVHLLQYLQHSLLYK